ncbi:MAG: hypothetical protein R3D27_14630 [Hyphomicrobiaceae bacterium]
MRWITGIIAVAMLVSLFNASFAFAQSPPATTVPPFPLAGAPTKPPVTISVSYQFFLTGDVRKLDDQTELADEGRKQIYRMLARECDVLLETIARECRIERANVNSQITRQRANEDGVRVTGSATYAITLKPRRQAGEAAKN